MKKSVEKVLQKYNLKYVKKIRSTDAKMARSELLLVESSNQIKYTLKIFDSKDIDAKERFINEVKYIRFLRSFAKSRFKNFFGNIKYFSLTGNNPYYIFKFVEGEPLGRFVKDMGIKWGYFHHDNFFEFLYFLDFVSEINVNDLKDKVQKWSYRYVQKELRHYFENVPNLLPYDLYDQIQTFVDKNHNQVFRHTSLSHRDLYPENVLIKARKSKKFTFLDWEYLSLVPIGFNAAFLYLLFWRESYWKGKILSYYYHKYQEIDALKLADFVKSFRFCLIVLSTRFIYQIESFADKKSQDYQHAKVSFLSDLESSLKGDIVKPDNIKFVLTKKDLSAVASHYDVGDVKSYEIFYASKGNTVARVNTKEKSYIFRFYSNSRSESLISRELKMFKKLTEAKIKTYDVIESKSGKLFIKIRLYGRYRKVAVLSFLKGSKIKQHWAKKTAARNAGQTLRKIHDCNVIHGDYSKENILFNKSKVCGVIDFEWGRITSSKEAKLSDMAKAIALWLIDIRYKNLDEADFALTFIEGYFGYVPKRAQLEKIKMIIINKVNEQRDIYLTTIDQKQFQEKAACRRFDMVLNKINGFNRSNEISKIVPSDIKERTY